MVLTKNCWSNAGKVSWRRTTYHGVPDQDHAPSNTAQEYHGGERYKRTWYRGRIMQEETCRHTPVGGGIPMLCGMSVMVGGLYIAAVCLESPARYYKILRIFLKPQPASFVPPSLPLPVQSGNRHHSPLKTQKTAGFLLRRFPPSPFPEIVKPLMLIPVLHFFRIAIDFYAI